MKTMVLYCTHCINRNVEFFFTNGYSDSEDIDFYVCINNPTLDFSPITQKLNNPKNLFVINRENLGLDFGAWSDVLLKDETYKTYDYFIFLNNTCTGPFLPTYVKTKWTDLLIDQIDSETKLVGATINHYLGKPHVQSYFMCTDRIGLETAIEKNIFSNEINEIYGDLSIPGQKDDLIEKYEVGFSKVILDAGYNIKCFMKALEGVDFRICRHSPNLILKHGITNWDMAYNNWYFGISINPYEVMFFKSNRDITPDLLNKYISFY